MSLVISSFVNDIFLALIVSSNFSAELKETIIESSPFSILPLTGEEMQLSS
jgi:hypothetical protein